MVSRWSVTDERGTFAGTRHPSGSGLLEPRQMKTGARTLSDVTDAVVAEICLVQSSLSATPKRAKESSTLQIVCCFWGSSSALDRSVSDSRAEYEVHFGSSSQMNKHYVVLYEGGFSRPSLPVLLERATTMTRRGTSALGHLSSLMGPRSWPDQTQPPCWDPGEYQRVRLGHF